MTNTPLSELIFSLYIIAYAALSMQIAQRIMNFHHTNAFFSLALSTIFQVIYRLASVADV